MSNKLWGIITIAIFDAVSRTITINGSEDQYKAALAIINDESTTTDLIRPSDQVEAEEDCPICLCDPDTPVQPLCGHKYCFGCFDGLCSNTELPIRCPGGGGACTAMLKLQDISPYISSATFEALLESSLKTYLTSHSETLRFCPTPNCETVYRCAQTSGSKAASYTCPKCLEQLCTFCHTQHGSYTCVEYKDIASGGYEALQKLREELNIKDCPRCRTPIEKTEGCNHMECSGCKTHFCWVCMGQFSAGEIYEHMGQVHSGIYDTDYETDDADED